MRRIRPQSDMKFTELALGHRHLLEHLQEGCQIIDFDWRYLYLNAAALEHARSPSEDLIGRTMMDCYPGIDASPMFAALETAMRERAVGRFENHFVHPDGTSLWFELRLVPVPEGLCVLSLDVTEKRHPLAAIVRGLEDAIIGQSVDGVVTSWNRSAELLFGYAAAEMIGQPFSKLYVDPHAEEEDALSMRKMAGGRVASYDAVRRAKSGELIDVAVTLSQVRDVEGATIGISKIVRDIRELRTAQREVIMAREATEAANKELEAFSYSVAHDLRAPLRSIDGFSQALLEDQLDALDEDGRRHLGRIRESAQLMGQLIDDLLDLSRASRAPLVRRAVDLSAMAREILGRFKAQDPQRRVELMVEDGVRASGDAHLLAIVLENLLCNAWKFTRRKEQGHLAFGVDAAENGSQVYYVADDGAGFDMTYVGKLFIPFQRLHGARDFEGTGIGLAIVERIVHRHDGQVWADGCVGKGATIRFTLPAPDRRTAAPGAVDT